MTTEQAVLLQLISSAVSGKDIKLSEFEIDWSAVMKESIQQAVVLSAFEAASRYKENIPPEIYQRWFEKACAVIANNATVSRSQSELIKLLDDGNYPYVILKGEAAAAYYSKPEDRSLGDVDFLIDPEQTDEIADMLRKKGYASSHEGHTCHIVFQKPKAHLEMHFEVAGIPHGECGEKVRDFMKDAHLCTVFCNNGTGEFKAPTPECHGLILLLHMQHHLLGEGIGLRHLCDWACFQHKTAGEPFWDEILIPLLKSIGLYTFASVMSEISFIYLGADRPEQLEPTDRKLCEDMLEDIMSGGNFGRKDELRGQSGMMISNRGKDGTGHGKLYNLYCILKSSTDEIYPQAKRYPILYAVYFPYRILRYIMLVIRGKRINLYKSVPLANKRKELYENLHIFEVKKNEHRI